MLRKFSTPKEEKIKNIPNEFLVCGNERKADRHTGWFVRDILIFFDSEFVYHLATYSCFQLPSQTNEPNLNAIKQSEHDVKELKRGKKHHNRGKTEMECLRGHHKTQPNRKKKGTREPSPISTKETSITDNMWRVVQRSRLGNESATCHPVFLQDDL